MNAPAQAAGRKGNTRHGRWHSRAYKTYYAMRNRCLNPNFHAYARYGGRGIRICQRWLDSFEAFYADMGDPPPGCTLERRNNDEGYSPDNCVWADRKTQANNMHRHRKLTPQDVAEIRSLVSSQAASYARIASDFGVSASTVCHIIKGKSWTNN